MDHFYPYKRRFGRRNEKGDGRNDAAGLEINMREFVLIEAPSNLGLAEPAPGVEPGVKFFPSAMEKDGFVLPSANKEKTRVDAPAYSTEIDSESKVRNAAKVIDYSQQLADALENVFRKKDTPVVIGGDCSILIGAALSLKRKGNYGLFFLDGHTDYVSPEQSGSAGAAGMDLAIVAGKGHDKLTGIDGLKPYFEEENIFCCGNRDIVENWYVDAIVKSKIHYFDLDVLRKKGLVETAKEFIKLVESKKLDGFWIHFDVDVLDDEIMPCVDSRQKDGLSYKELHEVLYYLIHSAYFRGIDITIFDPTLDKEGVYGKQLADHLTNLFKKES
jgi:arginase